MRTDGGDDDNYHDIGDDDDDDERCEGKHIFSLSHTRVSWISILPYLNFRRRGKDPLPPKKKIKKQVRRTVSG